MTTHDRDKVIAAAKDAGLFSSIPVPQLLSIERFYAIAFEAGRVAEREECAKVCDIHADGWKNNPGNNPMAGYVASNNCGFDIRARSMK